MKLKSFIIIFFVSLIANAQEDDSCRLLSSKSLNLIYKDFDGFNSYLKEKNLCIDTESKIKATSVEYRKFDQSDRILIETSKDEIYEMIKIMEKAGTFNNSDVEPCTFLWILFNTTYITSDYVRIKYQFKISYIELVKIKDNLNKDDVFSNLTFLGKN